MKAKHIAMQAITGTDTAKGKGYNERIEIEEHIENLIKEYAKQQRSLCLKNWSKPSEGELEDAKRIQNAPEPEYD